MKLNYRADIDGIRAIAVLAVVFYHLDIKLFSGGFVGVDIFFVISGFLITAIIVREIAENEFSLLKFYDRRIRRIFPALFTVLLGTLIAGALIFSAKEFKEFGNSLIATTLFVSNIFFWSQAGYFDVPSALKPLLHTWSLAVEEQYYIFFPLLLVFLMRFLRSSLKFILLGIAVASFAFSVYSLSYDVNSTFYLVHTRIWELLIGSLFAIRLIPVVSNLFLRNVLGVVGLTMLSLPIFFYTNDTPFPGAAALLPTLGTALIIYSGIESESQTFVAKLLSFQPVVFVGKISYSLYLWHWPVIVFAKYYLILELKTWETAAVLLLAFILATLSWLFVEAPFRHGTTFEKRKVFASAAVAMILMGAFGAVIYLNNGFPKRFSTLDKTASEKPQKSCNPSMLDNQNYVLRACTLGKRTGEPSFLLVGDSHARAIAPSVQASALRAGVTGIVVYRAACPILLEVHISSLCDSFLEKMTDYIQAHPNFKTIILSSRWSLYADGARYKSEGGRLVHLFNTRPTSAQNDTNATLFKLGLNRMVDKLRGMGRKVVIVSQIPEIGYNVPSVLSIAERTGRDINKIIGPSMKEYFDRNKPVIPVMVSLAEKENVRVVHPWKLLCKQEKCLVAIKGRALYMDDDHLSNFGAQYISSIFDVVFQNLSVQ